MATKFAVIDEDADLPEPSIPSEEKQSGDWRETANHILTLVVGVVVVAGLCTGSFYAGGYFMKPTYNQAKVDLAADAAVGDEKAESYIESTELCVDGGKHRKACKLLIKDAVSPKIASAKVTVPNEATND